MNASTVEFVEYFLEEGRRPEWFVTSPPYRNVFVFLKNACRIAKVGVAFNLELNFLEPVNSRTQWLMQNLPATVIVLTRATYRARPSAGVKPGSYGKLGTKRPPGLLFFSPRSHK